VEVSDDDPQEEEDVKALWQRSAEMEAKRAPQRKAIAKAKAVSFLGDGKSSLGDAQSSLGDVKSSLGDAESSLGDDKSSLGDAKSSLGDV
jgi:hypothetical protein